MSITLPLHVTSLGKKTKLTSTGFYEGQLGIFKHAVAYPVV